METIGIVGAGTMGHSIGQLAAMSGLKVTIFDVQEAALTSAIERITFSLDKLHSKERISDEDRADSLDRIRTSTDLEEAVRDADCVIEAIPEVLELKQEIFGRLDKIAAPHAILATNTSQLSITAIASKLDNPDRVIGTHFFNPPVLMRLVEIIRGLRTSDATVAAAQELTELMGKEAVVCNRDTVGFITTRAITALRLECIRIHEEGIASVADIDKALRLAFNHPMGQFELNDFNGLDVALQGAKSLQSAYGERFLPPASLVAKVVGGELGRKTGRGWYDYQNGTATRAAADDAHS